MHLAVSHRQRHASNDNIQREVPGQRLSMRNRYAMRLRKLGANAEFGAIKTARTITRGALRVIQHGGYMQKFMKH